MGNFQGTRFNGGRGRDRRSGDLQQMHSATCSKCGNRCQIPFKPTGNRPIFCNDCFRLEGRGSGRTENRRGNTGGDRPMYDAVCSKCGNHCQIPFQPRQGREIFCSHCFEQNGMEERNISKNPQSNRHLDELNSKLDKILELLSPKVNADKEEVVGKVKIDNNTDDKLNIKLPAKKKAVVKKKLKEVKNKEVEEIPSEIL